MRMKSQSNQVKRPWQPIALTHVGSIAAVVQGGGGKMSINAADTGDSPKKPKGQS